MIFFLYDSERLHSIASENLVKQGLAYFSENRVFALELAEGRLSAQVEDDENDEAFWLELTEHDGQLKVSCDCHEGLRVCRHTIAALYAYADQFSFADEDEKLLGGAVDEAIQERVKKVATKFG